ncbi:TPM domain-containing protein [Lachnospiraceae bacterium 62-35]
MERKTERWFLCMVRCIIITLFSLIVYIVPALGENEQRVFDNAGLFSEQEAQSLSTLVNEVREKISQDLVIVTVDDTEGKTSLEYADGFYDNGGFGAGDDYSGIIFLIDMDNRELTISACGRMIEIITNARLESMLDQLYGDISEGQYYDTAYRFIKLTEAYFYEELKDRQKEYGETNQGEGFSEEEAAIYEDRQEEEIETAFYKDGGEKGRRITAFEAIAAFLAAIGVAGGICFSIQSDYGMKHRLGRTPDSYMDYRRRSHFTYWQNDENLIHEFVTQRQLPKRTEPVRNSRTRPPEGRNIPRRDTRHSGRSTTHISRSGRTHGGGSRKF